MTYRLFDHRYSPRPHSAHYEDHGGQQNQSNLWGLEIHQGNSHFQKSQKIGKQSDVRQKGEQNQKGTRIVSQMPNMLGQLIYLNYPDSLTLTLYH